jgi:hypothetical protein
MFYANFICFPKIKINGFGEEWVVWVLILLQSFEEIKHG